MWGEKGSPPCRAPPLSKSAAFVVAYSILNRGFSRSALFMCLAVHRFLRTTELLRLRRGQIAVAEHIVGVHLVLPATKSSRRWGGSESAALKDRSSIVSAAKNPCPAAANGISL